MTASFGSAMLWGIILIYIVLVLLFRDFFQPVTIMMALPLLLGGAFLGLVIANQPLSLFAFIGLLMLMGLVTKNRSCWSTSPLSACAGMSRNAALMEAGMQRAPDHHDHIRNVRRHDPAAAGGASMAPRHGRGRCRRLMLSTLLSLVFVPAMFVLIDRLERWVQGFLPKPTPHTDEATARTPAE